MLFWVFVVVNAAAVVFVVVVAVPNEAGSLLSCVGSAERVIVTNPRWDVMADR